MKKIRKLLIFMLVLSMVLISNPAGTVNAANAENFDKSGILQVNVYHIDANTNTKTLLQSGSGFLISDSSEGAQYVITCDHVVDIPAETQAQMAQYLGVDRLNIKIEIVITRDITQNVTVTQASVEADFAILKLDQPIYERNPLVINSDGPNITEDVYAMGYPDAIQTLQDFVYYSEEDVVVTKGSVSNVNVTNGGVPYVQHSAVITAGNSGGPLLDSDGYVVGLNTFAYNAESGTYYYSLRIEEVTKALDALGISYQSKNGNSSQPATDDTESPTDEQVEPGDVEDTTTEPVEPVAPLADKSQLISTISTAQSYIAEDYTDESYQNLQQAMDEAIAVNSNTSATQAEVDSAVSNLQSAIDNLEEAKGNTMLIIIIAAAVLVVIIVVVIILVLSSKKKKSRQVSSPGRPQTPSGYGGSPVAPINPSAPPQAPRIPPVMPPQAPVAPPQPPVAPAVTPYNQNTVAGEGAGETSVLGYGQGETTVLSATNQRHATLTRVKTNEKVDIVKQLFTVGKERNKVDYCITNNNSVSRVHATIVYKSGSYYIIDNNSTNYTFVNGQMIPAKQEVAISDGDRIKLAEEEFIFKLNN